MISALLVDDSEFMRGLLKSIICKHQVEVICEADNGQVGVDMYKEHNPDIVFMDIMMDELNGVDALRQIMEYNPKAIVIMVSSMMTQKPFIDDAMSLGAKGVLNKPFDDKEVNALLEKIKPTLTSADG